MLSNFVKNTVTFMALWLSTLAFANTQRELELLFANKGKPPIAQSILFMRLEDERILYSKNADQVLCPASLTKLITVATVLTKFGIKQKFYTRFYHTGQNNMGNINGDLVVVGDGDPFVVSEKLWQLAADLKNLGIKEFRGDLIIDNSLFAGESRDESRKFGADQSSNAYDAPVSAFGVNFNTIAIAVGPGSLKGEKARVNLDPYPLASVFINSNVVTAQNWSKEKLTALRQTQDGKDVEKLILHGEIPVGAPLNKLYRSVGNHVQISGEYVKAFLAAVGISIKGQIKEGPLPSSAQLFYELESYDLGKIVEGLNKFSNNYISDVLLKRLGAAFPMSGKPMLRYQGSFENGLQVMTNFLKQEVKVSPNFLLKNGSGLDTQNRLSATQITKVLTHMAKRFDVFSEFLGSLPASGVDGTLKERFHGMSVQNIEGLIRAKTGTLSEPISVVGLAGYFRHPTHGMVAFTIIENGIPGKTQPSIADIREHQDIALIKFLKLFKG